MFSFWSVAVLKFLGLLPYDSDGIYSHLFARTWTSDMDFADGIREKKRYNLDLSYDAKYIAHDTHSASCSTEIKVNDKKIILSWVSTEINGSKDCELGGCGDIDDGTHANYHGICKIQDAPLIVQDARWGH